MRKTVASILAGAALCFGAGCVMVIGVRDREDRDLIEVNGETYRVDNETGRAHKVDCPRDKHDDTPKRDTDK